MSSETATIEPILEVQGTRLFRLVYDFLFDQGDFAPGGTIGPKKILGLQGGTRSGKTFSVNQVLLVAAHSPEAQAGGWEFETVRAHMATLRSTAMKDFFKDVMEPMGLYDRAMHNKSEHRYTIGRCELGWIGADGKKLRGNSREVLYCNEANELSEDEKKQLFQRTSLKIILDWNPDEAVGWLEQEMRRADAHVDISTYMDNPFAPEGQIEEVEAYVPTYVDENGELHRDWDLSITEAIKALGPASGDDAPYAGWEMVDGDENNWRVWGLGLEGTNLAQVFPTIRIVDTIPDDVGDLVYGVDFGFASPSAVVKAGVRDVGRATGAPRKPELYWDEILYAPRLTSQEIADAILADALADAVRHALARGDDPDRVSPTAPLAYCDHEGDRIADLVAAGIDAVRANKRSITAGIATVKRFVLCITKRSANLLRERKMWRFRIDPRTGKITDQLAPSPDHALDGGRYATHSHWGTEPEPATESAVIEADDWASGGYGDVSLTDDITL